MEGFSRMEQRRQRVLEILNRDGVVRNTALSRELDVTPVTVRSDLAALEQRGLLRRTQGGAVAAAAPGPQRGRAPLAGQNMALKAAIARRAAALVRSGETLMVNSGTTALLTAAALKQLTDLNIVTNALDVALELAGHPSFRVILLGGEVNAQYGFSYGADAMRQLGQYKADWAILSMDGISAAAGLTTYHAEEAEVDRQMMQRSARTMVVADKTKLGRESFSTVSGLECAGTLVTNAFDGPELEQAAAAAGVRLEMV